MGNFFFRFCFFVSKIDKVDFLIRYLIFIFSPRQLCWRGENSFIDLMNIHEK